MKTLQLAMCALAFAFASPAFCNADIFAVYDFDDGAPGGMTQSVFPNPSPVSPSLYNTRGGVTQNTSTTAFGDIATPANGGDIHAFVRSFETPDLDEFNSASGTNAAYHEFSITTPTGSDTYSLDSLHFEYWVSGAEAGKTYNATIYSDLVGYANSGFIVGTLQAQTNPSQPRTRSFNFNGATSGSFNNIAGGQTVGFRILFHDDASGSTGADHHRIDDVTLRGRITTAVPEPAAATLMMLVGGFVVLRRRRN
jgi:hypothetical protein